MEPHTSDDEDSDSPNEGYVNFQTREARGVLYKLNPMNQETQTRVTEYVHGGAMRKDLRYAREIFGLINTSGRKDFTYVWESPWVEEHVRDTAKRKRVESQQRSLAVKNFLKASSTHDSDNVEKFITNVDTLTKWEDKYDSKEEVKTISRVLQSFERVAVRLLLNFSKSVPGQQYPRIQVLVHRLGAEDVGSIANALRRSDAVFDLFANMVASEINWADSTNGSKNLSIHANKQLEHKKDMAMMKLIHFIDNISNDKAAIPRDTIGIPLMDVDFNLCVSHGIIVVGKDSTHASYILDIQGHKTKEGILNLNGVKTITITQRFSEETDMKRPKPELKSLVDL